ncbi:sigma D regulator [Colwellia sp. RE-S-Sl-9]
MQIKTEIINQVLELNEQTINNWLLERHKVLIAYCDLAGLTPNEQNEGALPQSFYIKHFCQILMDYISAGHFDIFEKIISAYQYSAYDSSPYLHEIYPKILVSTDLALQFNDKYAETILEEHLNAFDDNLSLLGKHLEQRFELEDSLLQSASRS